MGHPLLVLWGLLMTGTVAAQDNRADSTRGKPRKTAVVRTGDDYVLVEGIALEGNVRTKARIITRELKVAVGDTIYAAEAATLLTQERNKIVNTNLFVTVEVTLVPTAPQRAGLRIRVSERWYLFPTPIFELADRNFNEWWYDRGRSLRRVNYGLRLSHKNFRGRNEQLSLQVQFGFLRKLELVYDVPYLNRAQKSGFSFAVGFSENRDVAYKTVSHKLAFVQSPNIIRERFNASVGFSHRSQFYSVHDLEGKFNYFRVADTVARLNPDYYGNERTRQRYFQLSYTFTYDRRDAVAYPLRGFRVVATASKLGLLPTDDLNQLDVIASYTRYTPLGKSTFFNNRFGAKVSFPTRQPYASQRGLGYGQDFVRGYELNVIDGQAYALSKSTLKQKLFETQKTFRKIIPRQFNTVPFALYANLYFDMGYVSDRDNTQLANAFIYGGGIGIDVVTFYNAVFRVDLSVNRAGQRNFFLHFVRDI